MRTIHGHHVVWAIVGFAALTITYSDFLTAADGQPPTRILFVANDGLDSVHCGSRADQCRSISQAIENARDGDTIEVGLGRYGDVNGDGDFDDPGDEHAHTEANAGGGCMICVTKSVRIFSLHGADATIIDASSSGDLGGLTAVDIRAAGVIFGSSGHGFTLTSGNIGLGADGGRVGGNVALNNDFADFFYSLLRAGPLTFEDNIAATSTYGFFDGNPSLDQPTTLRHNLVIANTSSGIGGRGNTVTILDNIALGNGADGIGASTTQARVEGNVSVANFTGMIVGGLAGTHATAASVRHNTIIGNLIGGVFVSGSLPSGVHANNIYGNGRQALPQGTPEQGLPGLLNCGLVNNSEQVVQASGNYWGHASGPGPDPADEACNPGGGRTITDPPAPAFIDGITVLE